MQTLAERVVVVEEAAPDYVELQVLSLCRFIIIANSSFSWFFIYLILFIYFYFYFILFTNCKFYLSAALSFLVPDNVESLQFYHHRQLLVQLVFVKKKIALGRLIIID